MADGISPQGPLRILAVAVVMGPPVAGLILMAWPLAATLGFALASELSAPSRPGLAMALTRWAGAVIGLVGLAVWLSYLLGAHTAVLAGLGAVALAGWRGAVTRLHAAAIAAAAVPCGAALRALLAGETGDALATSVLMTSAAQIVPAALAGAICWGVERRWSARGQRGAGSPS